MSTPITPTEAHSKLASDLLGTTHEQLDRAAQLIAESEARAVADMASKLQSAFHEPLIAERDKLRAEVERLRKAGTDTRAELRAQIHFMESRAEKAEAAAERYRLASLKLDAELAKLRAASTPQ